MPESPYLAGDGLLDVKLLADGTEIDSTVEIVSIHIIRRANRIPRAHIRITDGDMPDGKSPVSDSATFVPGTAVEIQAGYESELKTLFKGIIIRHAFRIAGRNRGELVLECRDPAVKMTLDRKNANYINMSDSAVMARLVGAYGGLSPKITGTDTTYPELVQYYSTDWDFMLSRAEANGFLVFAEDGTLIIGPPDTGGSPVLSVEYGTDIVEFEADIDARHQCKKVAGATWDMASQSVVTQQAAPMTLNAQGNLDTAELAKAVDFDKFGIQADAPLKKNGLAAYVKSQMQKSGLARIRGKVRFQGNAKALPGKLIRLDKVGKRFNGNIYATSVSHTIADGNWFTDVTFGMDPDWFTETENVMAPPAAGLLPGIPGLQVGKVKKVSDDPEKEFRVHVSVPVMQAETDGVWARIAKFYGSNGFGSYFMPEKGDEVVLGYFADDPSHPVILGSLYSSSRPPPYQPEKENFIKAVVTRSRLKLEFNDDTKVITVETPAKNKIILSDKEKSILIQDQNRNKILLDPDGILMDSPKDIRINAKGKVSVKGTTGVDISSPADVTEKGCNISHTADVGFTAKGNATAELSAAGQTTVKGAMVMIN